MPSPFEKPKQVQRAIDKNDVDKLSTLGKVGARARHRRQEELKERAAQIAVEDAIMSEHREDQRAFEIFQMRRSAGELDAPLPD